ncbi:hypothetical protein FOS14_05900 [Skermania sp. ID1734]|uniref:hypothetical protein n=1 Tax=Skermania sp. ID1734 TaxID=2597516 RepID=UPI00117FCD5E|nr:hypothetical protein [Skermania sp. ID1734]TSE00577.1 hypothetical protein FOS14_05900 [Skermania sp. ID1734]
MGQLSFFSAEVTQPTVSDLSGLLAGVGQAVISGTAARISVVVDAAWRARAIAADIAQCGIEPEILYSEEGHPLVRTAPVAELVALATQWTRGAVKAVPADWTPGPRALRIWALACGFGEGVNAEGQPDRFVLRLDPHAPDTHGRLAQALLRIGIAPMLVGTRGTHPSLRIGGHRRMTRLAETIGDAPADVDIAAGWPGA